MKFFMLFILLFHQVAWAAPRSSYLREYDRPMQPREFTLQKYPNQKLVVIKVMGGVSQPGIYRVPEGTTLSTLLSYAGGLLGDSNDEEIRFQRQPGKGEELSPEDRFQIVTLNDLLKNDIVLPAESTVFIPKNEPIISDDTVLLTSMIASVLSIVLSVFLVSENLNKE